MGYYRNRRDIWDIILDNYIWILCVMLLLLFSCLGIILVESSVWHRHEDFTAIVVATAYTPSNTGSGIAAVPNSNGGVGVGTVVVHTSAKYAVLIETTDGNVIEATADPKLFVLLKPGDDIVAQSIYGSLTGMYYGAEVTQ